MIIRKCTGNDIQSTGELYDRVVSYLDMNINYPKWEYKIYPTGTWVAKMQEKGEQYICVDDGKIVAAFVLNTDPQGSYEKGQWSVPLPLGSYLVIHALAVDPQMFGQMIATKILKWSEQYAKDNGYKAIRIDIVPDNFPAQMLYEMNGYTFAGDADLDRGIDEIPVFRLFEKNF